VTGGGGGDGEVGDGVGNGGRDGVGGKDGSGFGGRGGGGGGKREAAVLQTLSTTNHKRHPHFHNTHNEMGEPYRASMNENVCMLLSTFAPRHTIRLQNIIRQYASSVVALVPTQPRQNTQTSYILPISFPHSPREHPHISLGSKTEKLPAPPR